MGTSSVYIHVIEDVVNKTRDEFVNNGGPGETVLQELQAIWELKMMQAGVLSGPIDRSAAHTKVTPGGPITPVHDLNMPYEGNEEYETPTADMLFPPTPLQTPIQTPLPGTADNSLYNIPTGQTDYSTPTPGQDPEAKSGRPTSFMPPPSPWMSQRPPLDVNVAYIEGRDEAGRGTSKQPLTQDFFTMPNGKRKRDEFPSQYPTGGYIPQQDGAADATPKVIEIEFEIIAFEQSPDYNKMIEATNPIWFIKVGSNPDGKVTAAMNRKMSSCVAKSSLKIPQSDGPIPDQYDDALSTPNIYNYQGVVNEDYNIANTPAPNDLNAGTPAIHSQNDIGDEDDEDDEPPLNENDDDDDLDDVDQGDELNTQHLVLAQFDKVTRTKSRWKCTLKDGIMRINHKDVLFNKATGEFDF